MFNCSEYVVRCLSNCLSILFLISFVCSAKQEIYFATDLLPEEGTRKADLVSQLVYYVTDELKNDYRVTFQQTSREREWRLIEKQSNICVYNKTHTPTRAKLAVFARQPLIVYAPNRLILNRDIGTAPSLSLTTALSLGLNIGVVKGRNYGKKLDELITQNSELLYVGAGSYKAERLEVMLKQGKLDGIIEYSSVFKSRQPDANIGKDYFIYALTEAQHAVKGYLACAKSDVGEKFVADFENVMNSAGYRAFAITKLHEASGLIEADFIIEQLGYK